MLVDKKGLIFNIQRFSLHDGPGIRSTVFMKGCPLRCRWCSNPESWNPYLEIITHDIKCIRCGKCEQICSVGAITIDSEGRKIDRAKCTLCLECAEVCPTGAISIAGEYVTVDEALREVESDSLFYQHSGGGVTVSGGEPLLQWEFVYELLKACKEKGLHTALDTSGYSSWDRIERVLEYVDLVLFDIKHMDPKQHKKGTSKSNLLILDNAARIAARKVRLWLRVPLIPGYNDSRENIEKVAQFGLKIGAEKISILPYHEWAISKYGQLGRRYALRGVKPPDDEQVQRTRELIEAFGIEVGIGR
ncbi:MAG: glycyl-radical enzyme activating protein [Chloroflexota bacterium]|nr:glycyl-radical enzyme activating protein [Chloroflexota bacterium]